MDDHADDRADPGAAPAERTAPGEDREALGAAFTRRWGTAMAAILAAATLLLLVLVLISP